MKTKWYSSALMIMALLIVAFVIGTTPNADATFKIRISDGSTTKLIEDEDFVPVLPNTDPDDYAGPGTVEYSGSIGVFTVVLSIASSKPTLAPGRMHLTDVHISGGAGTLTVEASDTGFISPVIPLGALQLDVGGVTGGTVNIYSYVDYTNALFGTGTTGPALGPFSGGAFSGTASAGISPMSAPYSLTMKTVVTHASGVGVTSSLDADIKVVPEPSTLLLLGCGLIGVAGFAWRRKKKQG